MQRIPTVDRLRAYNQVYLYKDRYSAIRVSCNAALNCMLIEELREGRLLADFILDAIRRSAALPGSTGRAGRAGQPANPSVHSAARHVRATRE